jgi:hypothetical protein
MKKDVPGKFAVKRSRIATKAVKFLPEICQPRVPVNQAVGNHAELGVVSEFAFIFFAGLVPDEIPVFDGCLECLPVSTVLLGKLQDSCEFDLGWRKLAAKGQITSANVFCVGVCI